MADQPATADTPVPAPAPARTAAAEPVAAPRGGKGRRLVRILAAAVFAGFIIVIVAGQWPQVRPLLGRLSVPSVAGAGAAVFAGIFGTFLCWRAVLRTLGYSPPLTGGMRIFFIGQLGKYLPGSIWPVVAQMELGRDYKIPARASGTAVIVFMVTILGTGLAVAAPTLPLLSGDAVGTYWWTWAVLPIALIALTPAVANRVLGVALRLLRRPPLPSPLTSGGMLRAAGWSVLAWLGYGLQTWILVRQFGTPGGVREYFMLTGAFAAAWCVGFLVVFAPAGAGVREAAFLLLLAGTVARPQATAFAVVSRLLFTAGDLGWGTLALILARRGLLARRGRADGTAPAG